MPRLIVDAVAGSYFYMPGFGGSGIADVTVQVLVAVSYAENGVPVSKLKRENFAITNVLKDNDTFDATSIEVKERTMDPDDNVLSGFYDLVVRFPYQILANTRPVKEFSFGIQVLGPQWQENPKFWQGLGVVRFKVVELADLKQ